MTVIEVDFSDVQDLAGFLPPGNYDAKVTKVEQRDGRNYPGLAITAESIEEDTAGMTSQGFLSLAPKALWKLYGVMQSMNLEVPKDKVRFDDQKMVGHIVQIKVINDPWTDAEGKVHDSSKIDQYFPPKVKRETTSPDIAPPAEAFEEPVNSPDDDDIPF